MGLDFVIEPDDLDDGLPGTGRPPYGLEAKPLVGHVERLLSVVNITPLPIVESHHSET